MKYGELVARVGLRTETSMTFVEPIIGQFLLIIAETLASGEEVRLPGVGVLAVRDHKGQDFRIVHGQHVAGIKPYKRVQFSANQQLKDKLNGR